jgi:hypothetical protein
MSNLLNLVQCSAFLLCFVSAETMASDAHTANVDEMPAPKFSYTISNKEPFDVQELRNMLQRGLPVSVVINAERVSRWNELERSLRAARRLQNGGMNTEKLKLLIARLETEFSEIYDQTVTEHSMMLGLLSAVRNEESVDLTQVRPECVTFAVVTLVTKTFETIEQYNAARQAETQNVISDEEQRLLDRNRAPQAGTGMNGMGTPYNGMGMGMNGMGIPGAHTPAYAQPVYAPPFVIPQPAFTPPLVRTR